MPNKKNNEFRRGYSGLRSDNQRRTLSKPGFFDENWRDNPGLSSKERAEQKHIEQKTIAYLLAKKALGPRFGTTKAQEAKLGRILDNIRVEKETSDKLLLGQGVIEELMMPGYLDHKQIERTQAKLVEESDLVDLPPPLEVGSK